MRLPPKAFPGLVIASSVPSALAVTFNDFQPILSFPTACLEVYTSTIPGCRLDDFRGGNPCSADCIKGVQSKSKDLNKACVGVRVTPTTLIGLFFQGKGVVALCPNFDPPPPNDGGSGSQTNNNPPQETTTSIDGPPPTVIPTVVTTTSTVSDDTTRTQPPPTTSTTETTTRWEVTGLQITIFGTDSGGIITADPTEPTQTTSTATATSAGNDINNIAGSGDSVEMMSLAVSFRNCLATTILMALCTAAALW